MFFYTFFSLGISPDDNQAFKKKRRKNKKRQEILSIALGYNTSEFNNRLFYSISPKMEHVKLFDSLVGLCIFLIGITVRWISIIQLNKAFTVDVVIAENHKLKTDGIYKSIRHPSYFGLLLICFGLSIAMNSIISIVVITIPVSLAITYRIKIEENTLMNEFGDTYESYMTKTHKIIPKLY